MSTDRAFEGLKVLEFGGGAAGPIAVRHLADHGATPWPPTGQPALLSPRELEVARLAAARLRSKEIADRCGLSVRTVDNHLARVYRKLGVTGRDDLPDALAALGGTVTGEPGPLAEAVDAGPSGTDGELDGSRLASAP